MAGRLGWLAVAALVATSIAVPTSLATHCDTKINVYGRISLAPIAPPPYSSATAGVCLRVLNGAVDEHVLPPNTDQVTARVNGDFGPAVPTIDAEFDGLGFVDMHYPLVRTVNPAGGYTYNLADWLDLPNGITDGELTVTITQPGGIKRSITYHTTLSAPLPVPP